MNEHRGILNRLQWMQDAYGLTAADRVLQKTPFSFDVSVWELFWPLMTGARLVVATPGGHRDNAYLARLIAGERITVLHFVPSMLQLFLEEPGVEECRSLCDVVCSGEALSAELARRFASRLGHARPAGTRPDRPPRLARLRPAALRLGGRRPVRLGPPPRWVAGRRLALR